MGISSSRRKSQILVVGLDAAGKTTMLYKMRPQKVETTIPTIGFNVEHATLKSSLELISMDAWDVGGRDKIRPLWRHFYAGKDAVIFVVDSQDRDRFPEVMDEIRKIATEDELADKPLLIFANKQDLPNAVPASELIKILHLQSLRQPWHIVESSMVKNKGIKDGFEWLTATIHGGSIELPDMRGIAKDGHSEVEDASTVASDGELTPKRLQIWGHVAGNSQTCAECIRMHYGDHFNVWQRTVVERIPLELCEVCIV